MREQIPAALDGQRVDRVASLMTGRSRSVIASLVSEGKLSCSGELVVAGSQRVKEGDWVEIEVPADDDLDNYLNPDPEVDFELVHVDEWVVVIDKPINLVVHPGAGTTSPTLAHGLIARFPEIADIGPRERPGIVHRLDRDTSGLLVCARTDEALSHLTEEIGTRSMRRSYLVIAGGRPEAATGTIDAPIGRSRRSRTKMTVTEEGREARTHYEVLETWDEPVRASLLRCDLDTGRTHQIRVHLRAIDTPVLGDSTYGKPDPFEIGRPLLHAAELSFIHPATGLRVNFSSEPPSDFLRAMETFRKLNSKC
ncbi:MAG: RluA family pseudouridine synthase [Actinomycetota bacterium]|nr:RluA family pseudouridine synthase [Acidimicrobiales bacterium]MEC7873871.1 RluA family pseudouridine synthase [Actinomycetota bacterium]